MDKMAEATGRTRGQTLEDADAPGDVGGDEGSILQWVLKRLQDSNPHVRMEAIEALSECRADRAIDCLIERAQTDQSVDVRCAALLALGQFIYLGTISNYEVGDPEAFEEIPQQEYDRTQRFLFSVYHDEGRSLDERECAVEALSFGGGDDILEAVAALYARPEKTAKMSALRAMGHSGAARWLEIVGRELYSDDLEIQLEAIGAAGEMSAESLGKDLLRLTYSENQDVMLGALWSLGQTGWEGAFDRLDEFTLHPDAEIREIADEAMDEWLFFNGLASDSPPDEEDELLDVD